MITRRIKQLVEDALSRQAAVGLIGPRQVGKTTLALEIGEQQNALYLDLESREDRARLDDPALFLRHNADRLVILDEIHRMPEIFQVLRGLIDQGRRQGRRTNRFLILGSASIDLLRQSGESLAGRIEYIDMGPFDLSELPSSEDALNQLWVRGGFPDIFLAKSDDDSLRLRRSFIRTYLERDIAQFGPRIPAETLERLWTMLAHNQGATLNASRLAAGLSVSAPTVTGYIDLLTDLLLIRRLSPHLSNVGKRLVKSPKVYVRDSGLLHALLGIPTLNDLLGNPVVGASWEGFVIENILACAPEGTVPSFFRTAAGAEIDLLLQLPGRHGLWAIEIRRNAASKPEKGFYVACEDLEPRRRFLVHPDHDSFPLKEDVTAIGLASFLELLKSL